MVVVDDHQFLCEGLRLRLEKEPDFEVVGTAGDTREACACVEATAPDLVIMDLHLPGENGIVATRRIRPANPLDVAIAHEALIAGAHGLMRKVSGGDTLVRAVRVLVAGGTYFPSAMASSVPDAFASGAAAGGHAPLNKRELAVLEGIAEGLSYKEIAGRLHLSVKSIEYYRAVLVRKTGCGTRAELVRLAIRLGLIAA
jgi:DNA-binding NarL/FixJ family response regulator